jgi:hypothetical protein
VAGKLLQNGDAMSLSRPENVATYPSGRCGVTVFASTTDRQAEHVQVAVVSLVAAEILERATLARIMATMGRVHEARFSGDLFGRLRPGC